MNRVPVIVQNPAYIEEVELDEDEVDPADITPLISGDSPIITVPGLEDDGVAEAASEDSKDDIETEDVSQILRDVIADLEKLNKEMRSILSPTPGDTSSLKSTVVPNVDVWDTKKALEQEYRLHPDPSIDEISSRLFNQVWDLLQILQEWVDQRTCNNIDIKLIDGLQATSVMHARLGRLQRRRLNVKLRNLNNKGILTNNYVNSLSLCNMMSTFMIM